MSRRDRFKTAMLVGTAALTAAAVATELRKPAGQRDWHGRVLGVPYDLRIPTPRRLKRSVWNPDDPRLFPPRAFGVGWSVNLARVAQALQGAGVDQLAAK